MVLLKLLISKDTQLYILTPLQKKTSWTSTKVPDASGEWKETIFTNPVTKEYYIVLDTPTELSILKVIEKESNDEYELGYLSIVDAIEGNPTHSHKKKQ